MNLAQIFAVISSLDPGSGFGGFQPIGRGFSSPPPMRFNPNARLDTSQVIDRRGMPSPLTPMDRFFLEDWIASPQGSIRSTPRTPITGFTPF